MFMKAGLLIFVALISVAQGAELANPFFISSGISENPDGTFYVASPVVWYNGASRYIHFDNTISDMLCTQFDFSRAANAYQSLASPYYATVMISAAGDYTYYPENSLSGQIKIFSGLLCLR